MLQGRPFGKPGRKAWLCSFALVLSAAPALADEGAAQRQYAAALELVRAGDLGAARVAFESAYRESPHYLVLYNLARVCRDLGELESAEAYLARYLADGGARVPAPRRAEAERELAELRRELTRRRASEAATGPGAPVAKGAPEPAGQPAATKAAEPTALALEPTAATSDRAPAAPALRPLEPAEAARRARWSGVSLALTATGGVLIGVGSGVLIWDRGRHADWERESRALAAVGSVSVDPNDGGSSLQAARALQQRADRNDALSESIRDFDRVGWVSLVSGSALVVTAVVVWLSAGEGPRMFARKDGAELSFAF